MITWLNPARTPINYARKHVIECIAFLDVLETGGRELATHIWTSPLNEEIRIGIGAAAWTRAKGVG